MLIGSGYVFIDYTLAETRVAASNSGVLLISGPDTHSQGENMASKKTTPQKAVAKKAAPQKGAPTKKKAAPKPKKQVAKKAAAPKATSAKKPGRPSKKVAQKPEVTPKAYAVSNTTTTSGGSATVSLSPSQFTPTTLPSNVVISAATGSVPPESIRKQLAGSVAANNPAKKRNKKKGIVRRFFGLFKRSK